MDGLRAFVVVLLAFSWRRCAIHGSKVTVRPGDDITLHCDCRPSSRQYTVWFRNCSHENQPTLVLNVKDHKLWTPADNLTSPHFKFVKNNSSNSYDLLIRNVTESDEGLYYCGTEELKVEDEKFITSTYIYKYSNITTTITVDSGEPTSLRPHTTPLSCSMCCTLLFSLCPVCAVVSSLVSSLLVYHLCGKRGEKLQADPPNPGARSETQQNQSEDVCYAALEIRQPSQRPKKKRVESSDFSTYSAIKTSRM